MRPFPHRYFRRPAEVVARDLIGATIVSTIGGRRVAAWVVETEAYLGAGDPASHAYRGRRHPGNDALYGPAGTWYVYRSYGIHWCANLVALGRDPGSAVLLRAVLPYEGLALVRRRRPGVGERSLADGPGKLCQAMGITRALDGRVMRGSAVTVGRGPGAPGGAVLVTPRIGITRAVDWPLRFVLRPEPSR